MQANHIVAFKADAKPAESDTPVAKDEAEADEAQPAKRLRTCKVVLKPGGNTKCGFVMIVLDMRTIV